MKKTLDKAFIKTEIKQLQLLLMEAYMGDIEMKIPADIIKDMIWKLEQVKQHILSKEERLKSKSSLETFFKGEQNESSH